MKSSERAHTHYGATIRAVIDTKPTNQLGDDLPRSVVRAGDAPFLKHARLIPVDRIIPDPDQPRRDWSDEESLRELGESIKSRGLLQPIRVRRLDDGNWMVITGERRLRAARLAGVQALPAIEVAESLTPNEILEDQLVENCLRQNLAPIEQAHAFKALLDATGMSQRALAERLHMSHVSIVQALALLKLPQEVQDRVEQGELAPTTAYEVTKLESPVEQAALAAQVVNDKLTRDEVVAAVREQKSRAGDPSPNQASAKSSDLPDNSQPPIQESIVPSHPTTPVEITLDRDRRVQVFGVPVGAGIDAVLEVLQLAMDKLKAGYSP